MSKLWTAIKVANICFMIHLVLIAVGETVTTASTEPICREWPFTSCVYVVAGTQETLWSVAHRFDVTTGTLWIANPTAPLLWPLSPGARIWIPLGKRDSDF